MMKRIAVVIFLLLASMSYSQETSVSLSRVDTLINGELPHSYPISFYFRITNLSSHDVYGNTNGFRIYSPDGAIWRPYYEVEAICGFVGCFQESTWYGRYLDEDIPPPLVGWHPEDLNPGVYERSNLFLNWFSVDGVGADTLGFAGFSQNPNLAFGFFSGFIADPAWSINLFHIDSSSAGKTLCIDSSYFPPYGRWIWANDTLFQPNWDGPHCWKVSAQSLPPPTHGVVSIDSVFGIVDGAVPANALFAIYLRATNPSFFQFVSLSNGFRIYSPDGATWNPLNRIQVIGTTVDTTRYAEFLDLPDRVRWTGTTYDPNTVVFDSGAAVSFVSDDGRGDDLIGFSGSTGLLGTGIQSGFDYNSFGIFIDGFSESSVGKTICIDTAYIPSVGHWRWQTREGEATPRWDGPHCWTISAPTVPPPPPPPPGFQSVTLDSIVGLVDGRLQVNKPIDFYFRIRNNSSHTFSGSANGFRIYSPDGATWVPYFNVDIWCPFTGCQVDTTWYGEFINSDLPNGLNWNWRDPQIYDGGVFVNVASADGAGSDTIGFAGFSQNTGVGLFPQFDYLSFRIMLERIPEENSGKTICIDSSYWAPSGRWLWSNDAYVAPYWDGPHCFEIGDCCVGMRGNIDLTNDGITIADLTALVQQLYVKRELDCPHACNVDGDPAETVDIVDLVYLIDYMFRGGPEPAACP